MISLIHNRFDTLYSKIQADIDGPHGFNVMGIFSTTDRPGPSFNYTIGLQKMGLPELLIFGLNPKTGHFLIHRAVEALRANNISDNGIQFFESRSVANLKTMLVRVDTDAACKEHSVITANFFPEMNWTTMQIVWPDKDGLYPWQSGCDRKMHKIQCGVEDLFSLHPDTIILDKRDVRH